MCLSMDGREFIPKGERDELVIGEFSQLLNTNPCEA